jgi:hypothetical protein
MTSDDMSLNTRRTQVTALITSTKTIMAVSQWGGVSGIRKKTPATSVKNDVSRLVNSRLFSAESS